MIENKAIQTAKGHSLLQCSMALIYLQADLFMNELDVDYRSGLQTYNESRMCLRHQRFSRENTDRGASRQNQTSAFFLF